MNLFKIVRKKTDKGKGKSSPVRDACTLLLFVFLLPYVISCLWGNVGEEIESVSGRGKNKEAVWIDEKYEINLAGSWGVRKMSLQEYLIRKLEVVMGEENDGDVSYEPETLKAQSVLLRTEIWELLLSGDEGITIHDDAVMYDINKRLYSASGEAETMYEKAVKETDGICLSYDGKPVKAAFFPVSSGKTRDASENWKNVSYPYLVSVECSQDILSKNYQSQVSVSVKEYMRIIRDIWDMGEEENAESAEGAEFIYDSAGYVAQVCFDGYSCSGETFRNAFGLNSASFQTEWKDDEVVFHVKGMGHGFGMSQYDADKKAASGENFEQILKYYFFQTELAKIE